MKISIPHSWRKLNDEKRLDIPNKVFGIPQKTVEDIRKLKNPKKRLIEAAKLQYELYKDIHNDLTTWIAGYLSEVTIRQKFGSAKNLRKVITKENYKLKNWMDIKRNVCLPESMNETLAEETGIHIGDGSLYKKYEKNKGFKYRYSIHGNLIDDYLYHTKYVKKILKSLYNYDGNIVIQNNKNSIANILNSKEIVEFKNIKLGLPIGDKKSIEIPKEILKNNLFTKKCIIGIIDTDFNLSKDLSLIGKMHSLKLMKQISKSLIKLKIDHSIKENSNHSIIRIKKKDSIKILEDWKINNEKHISKYRIWKEFKTYIAFTATPERLLLLEGKMDIAHLKRISENRKINKNTP